MGDFLTALGLAMAIEGAAYALFPNAMRRMMAQVLEQPSNMIRMVGLSLAALGVGVVWLVRG